MNADAETGPEPLPLSHAQPPWGSGSDVPVDEDWPELPTRRALSLDEARDALDDENPGLDEAAPALDGRSMTLDEEDSGGLTLEEDEAGAPPHCPALHVSPASHAPHSPPHPSSPHARPVQSIAHVGGIPVA